MKQTKKYERPLNTHTKPELQKRFTKVQLTDYIKELERMKANQVGLLEKALARGRADAKTVRVWETTANKWEQAWEAKSDQVEKLAKELYDLRQKLSVVTETNGKLERSITNYKNTIDGLNTAFDVQSKHILAADTALAHSEDNIARLRNERKEFFALAIRGGKL